MTACSDDDWNPVGDGTPLHAWLETKRDGEDGTSISYCRLLCIGDEPEWVSTDGRTTVTHSTYAPPTHWRWSQRWIGKGIYGSE